MRKILLLVISFFCFLFGGAACLEAQQAPARIWWSHITSEPTGALVVVDGREHGYTPTTFRLAIGADVGAKRVVVSMPYYVDWDSVMIASNHGDTLYIHVTLEREKARLTLRLHSSDNPSDTHITLDGEGPGNTYHGLFGFTGIWQQEVARDLYKLVIKKAGHRIYESEIIVHGDMEVVVDLSRDTGSSFGPEAIPAANSLLEDYVEHCAPFLEAMMRLDGDPPSPIARNIGLNDERCERLLLKDMELFRRYTDLFLRDLGKVTRLESRPAAFVYTYLAIGYGKYRRFPEAAKCLTKARELWLTVTSEPPLYLKYTKVDSVGDLTRHIEEWSRRLGRMDVVLSPIVRADKELRSTLVFLRHVHEAEAPDEFLPATPTDKAMQDSLVLLAEQALRDSIKLGSQTGQNAFSLFLPKGSYVVADSAKVFLPVSCRVVQPALAVIEPRVRVWLPEFTDEEDTMRVEEVTAEGNVPAFLDRLTFGKVYDFSIRIKKYGGKEPYKTRIIFHPAGWPRPQVPEDVVLVECLQGEKITYLATKLKDKGRRSSIGNSPGMRRQLLRR